MSVKTDSRYNALVAMSAGHWAKHQLPFWTNTGATAMVFEISKPTAWRLLEDAVKTGLLFKVQYTKGTFTYSNYINTFHYAKIGGRIPHTHLKHAKAWLASNLIHGELESICGGHPTPSEVEEVYKAQKMYLSLLEKGQAL